MVQEIEVTEAERVETGTGGSDEPPRRHAARFRLLGINVLVLSSSLIVTLGMAEVAIRMVSPQQLVMIRPDLWMPVDTLGWQRRPNVDTEVNTGEGTVRVITDAEGFRVGSAGRKMANDSILLIGDSFMEALQVEYEESLAGLLEDSLLGPRGESVAVRNTGVGSWDPPHYRLLAQRRLAANAYDLVLVAVFLGNDVVRRTTDYFPPRAPTERASFSIPLSLSPADWIDGVARPLNDLLEVRSHLFVLAKNATEPIRIKLGLSAAYIPRSVLIANVDGPEWEITAGSLASIAEVAGQKGVPTLFVLIPERYQVNVELFESHLASFGLDPSAVDLEQPNRRLLEELTARGLRVVDALPALRDLARRGQGPLYGSVDPHFSPEGHLALFHLLRPTIDSLLWVDAASVASRR